MLIVIVRGKAKGYKDRPRQSISFVNICGNVSPKSTFLFIISEILNFITSFVLVLILIDKRYLLFMPLCLCLYIYAKLIEGKINKYVRKYFQKQIGDPLRCGNKINRNYFILTLRWWLSL